MTIAGILTVAVSLALFGGIMLLSKWVDHGTEQIKGGVRAEIFMNVERHAAADRRRAQRARRPIREIKSFKYFDKAGRVRGVQEDLPKDPDLVKNITADALPTSFRIVPNKAELTEQIKRRYQTTRPASTSVDDPGEALRGLLDATNTTKYIFIGLSLVLLASSLFLIVNTIRLATFARRREIEVMKLVGASNWFVRVPFMAEGLVQGLIGAGLAIGGVVALKIGFDTWFDGPQRVLPALLRDRRRRHRTISVYVADRSACVIGLVGLGASASAASCGSEPLRRRRLAAVRRARPPVAGAGACCCLCDRCCLPWAFTCGPGCCRILAASSLATLVAPVASARAAASGSDQQTKIQQNQIDEVSRAAGRRRWRS